jgi:predicted nucleic acid-binding protein
LSIPAGNWPLLPRAFDLASRHQLPLWDCVYLAPALERECELLTADRRLFRSGGGRHPAILLVG